MISRMTSSARFPPRRVRVRRLDRRSDRRRRSRAHPGADVGHVHAGGVCAGHEQGRGDLGHRIRCRHPRAPRWGAQGDLDLRVHCGGRRCARRKGSFAYRRLRGHPNHPHPACRSGRLCGAEPKVRAGGRRHLFRQAPRPRRRSRGCDRRRWRRRCWCSGSAASSTGSLPLPLPWPTWWARSWVRARCSRAGLRWCAWRSLGSSSRYVRSWAGTYSNTSDPLTRPTTAITAATRTTATTTHSKALKSLSPCLRRVQM